MTAKYDGISRWHCTECGHSHTGRDLAYICIGCPCDFVPDHPVVDAHIGRKDGGR